MVVVSLFSLRTFIQQLPLPLQNLYLSAARQFWCSFGYQHGPKKLLWPEIVNIPSRAFLNVYLKHSQVSSVLSNHTGVLSTFHVIDSVVLLQSDNWTLMSALEFIVKLSNVEENYRSFFKSLKALFVKWTLCGFFIFASKDLVK